MMQMTNYNIHLSIFSLVNNFHVPYYHLWEVTPSKKCIAKADMYIPWLNYKYNRKLQSQEKKGIKTASKIKGQILPIIHSW